MSRRSGSAPRNTRTGTAGLEQRVLARFRALALDVGRPIVIAFSGGPDSLALAAVLSRLRPWLDRELVAVHVDHGMRESSAVEAGEAVALAAQLDLRCEVVRVSEEDLDRHLGVGVEEAARRERYLALARAATTIDARVVAVGHQRDDQAETVLLHLLRGSGIGGAAGMEMLTDRTVPWWHDETATPRRLHIWRPLLPEPRSTLARYLQRLGLRPLHDESNADPRYRRNAIRHRVLPCLEEVSPGATEALARFGRLAAADDAFLDRLTDERMAGCVVDGHLDPRVLAGEAVALQRRLIRRWLTDRGAPAEVTAERVDAVRRMALTGRGRSNVDIGAGLVVRRTGGRLSVVCDEGRSLADDTR